MSTLTTTELLPIGCLFDGTHGYETNAKRVIALAIEKGMVREAGQTLDIWTENEAQNPALEALTDDEHAAQDYLGQFAPAGHWVGWQDGDFGVWPDEDEENEEDDNHEHEPRDPFAGTAWS